MRSDLPTTSRLTGWARLLRNALRFWAGYVATVRPALRAGKLVIGDRWAYGYIVNPQLLRFNGPEWLARLVVSTLPKPDLVVCLTAPPDVIVSRKPELTHSEAAEENEAWQTIPVADVLIVDARLQPADLADVVIRELHRHQ